MNIGWPEGIMFGIYALNIVYAIGKDGEPKTGNVNLAQSMLGSGISFGLLYWGGFFA